MGDGRKEDVGRDRPAGQRRVAGGESGEQFANWARGAGVLGRRGAAQQRGPHLCKPPVWREMSEQRDVACHTARSQRGAQQRPVTSRETDAKQTWGEIGPPGGDPLQAKNGKRTVFELGTHHGHRLMPRRSATTPPHLCKPPPRATRAKKTRGESGRPGNEALPAVNRENGLRIGHAARASSDAVARRNSGGRIFATKSAAPEGDARATSLCISMVYMPTPRPNMCRSTPHVKLMD